MFDIPTLKAAAARAEMEGCPIEFSPEALGQLIEELEAGRAAMAHAGEAFGLPRGETVWG